VPVILGAGILLMSLMTDYELSLTRVIPMGVHLAVDGLGGALLAVSPWLFGFADRTFWPSPDHRVGRDRRQPRHPHET
jgi:hypothetical protein